MEIGQAQHGVNGGMKKTIITCALFAIISVASGCATKSTFDHLTSDDKASTFNAELGTNYLAAGELESAETKLQRALEQNPNNALANNAYAMLRAELDDPEGADNAFQKSIRLDAKRAEYRNNYAIFLCDRGRTEEAVDQFVTASENKFYNTPEYALDNAGVCAMDADQLALAETHLRSAIRLNPNFAPSMLHMAELKLKTGDADVADAYYSRHLSLTRHSPQSLAVGIKVKQAVGEQATADEFAQQLVTRYPRSKEAKGFLAAR